MSSQTNIDSLLLKLDDAAKYIAKLEKTIDKQKKKIKSLVDQVRNSIPIDPDTLGPCSHWNED